MLEVGYKDRTKEEAGFPKTMSFGVILVLYRDNGTENGNYYLGLRFRVPKL